MTNPDFMRVLRVCSHCRGTDETVLYSNVMNCYICDSCYTDHMDSKEQANIDACYSNGEQDY